ncbi:UDP-glucose/GDP-mannose dehydrogenase family protein [bacterium]|nr:UDP-glucose/GDP-mannose dehydrogenase family protein [bacterium]
MKVCVIGTGYVGLVVGACLAEMGNDVICVDNNEEKLSQLKKGVIPIYEPKLEELIKTNYSKGRLVFTSDICLAIQKSLICFIAVGTPQDEDGSADLNQVETVAKTIAESIEKYTVIVDKSTVPVGTAEKLAEIIKSKTNVEFDIVSNPEFLKQGSAVDDFLNPDRVIIGSNSEKASQIMQELYAPFLGADNSLILMDTRSAEMTKYASNAFLALKISYANQIANICECIGADVENVRLGMSADKRIGSHFLFSGLGFGGSCFPKDVRALIKTAADNGCDYSLLQATEGINEAQRQIFIKKILNKFNDNVNGKTFAVWGLAFKPETNDMREAPSITVINALLESGAKIQAYDPKALDVARIHFGDKIQYFSTPYEALDKADALLLLTEWREFKKPDFQKIKSLMKTSVIFDGRNQYDPNLLANLGFDYNCVGRNF